MRAPLARKRARSTNLTRVRSQIYTPSRRYWSVRRALWMRGRWCGSPAPSMTPACVHPSAHAAVKLAVPVSAPQASPGGRCRPMMVLGVASSTRLCAACAAVPPPGCRLGSLDGQRSALRCLRCPPLPLPCVLRARLRRVARRVLGRRGRRCWTAVARVPPMRGFDFLREATSNEATIQCANEQCTHFELTSWQETLVASARLALGRLRRQERDRDRDRDDFDFLIAACWGCCGTGNRARCRKPI